MNDSELLQVIRTSDGQVEILGNFLIPIASGEKRECLINEAEDLFTKTLGRNSGLSEDTINECLEEGYGTERDGDTLAIKWSIFTAPED